MNNRPISDPRKIRSYNGDYMVRGRVAESVVRAWLTDHPDVVGLTDLTDVVPMREVDSDFTIRLRNGTNPIAEVKHDHNLGRTGNMLFESMRINHKAPPHACSVLGWSVRTQAQWILWYGPQVCQVWQISADGLRTGYQRYTDKARDRSRMVWVNTDNIKSTLNILIPLGYVMPFITKHDVTEYAREIDPLANSSQASMNFQTALAEY